MKGCASRVMVAKSGRSSRWVVCRVFLRPGQSRHPDGAGGQAGVRQTSAQAHPRFPDRGRARRRAGRPDYQGDAAGWAALAAAVEPDAGRPGQGVGDTRPPLCPLRRRLQPLRAVPARGRAGHGKRDRLPHPATEADGERSQERGGPPVGAGFPGLQLHGRTDASAGRLAEGARPVQGAGSGTDAPHEARQLHPSRGETVPLPRWVAGLFRTLRGPLSACGESR